MTIAEFILSRIAEDEAVANYAASEVGDPSWRAAEEAHEGIAVWSSSGRDYGHESNTTDHIARHDPARVLAECAAKRAIVQSVTVPLASLSFAGATRVPGDDPSNLLGHLATIYADHPDYDPAWRP